MLNLAKLAVVTLVCLQVVSVSGNILQQQHKYVPTQVKTGGATSSTAQPRPVPDSWKNYQQLAVMAQDSNCKNTKINDTLGDATLLYKFGDDNVNQYMHVFHSKSMGVTFSWAGLNLSNLDALASVVDLPLVDANKTLYPNAEEGTQLYQGFQSAYGRVADIVQEKALEYTKKYNDNRVSFTGLSFGAALSALSSVHIHHVLAGKVKVHKVVVFGLPRIGNQAWANTVDRDLKGTFYYTVNGADPLSRLPPRFLGYQQSSGQLYIKPANSTQVKFYPGQENVHGSDADIGLDIQDHTGVYFSVAVGGSFGPCPAKIPSALQ
ncbi:hypothetical protein MYAM1_001562 [Malassezia yamatoensis]|uniref:Fungal lipase-type domain-containing protein n=1 Tax=Malassezia yamatoensis TaxID=253288 RepID=A0AAJ5YYJ7_9BASI|nr:hypothetical protein MYAM1_001562 [Malassezia yamatoensis]